MLCPECGKEMKHNYKEGSKWTIADWDSDYPSYWSEDRYSCPDCKIRCVNGVWTIPKCRQASEKQIRAVEVICSVLDIDEPPLSRRSAWAFIRMYMQESKRVSKLRKDHYYDSMLDWQ